MTRFLPYCGWCWAWCSSRTVRKKCWVGLAGMASRERWASLPRRHIFRRSTPFWQLPRSFSADWGLILGLLTRIAAFGITVNMLVAIFAVHMPNGFFMNWTGQQKGEGFEYHLLVLAITVALMIRGGGAFSVDRAIGGE